MTARQTYAEPTSEPDIYFDDPAPDDRAANLADILTTSRTWEARANRFAVLQWLGNPIISQKAAAKKLRITPRRFRQIISEIRNGSISSRL